MAEAMGKEAEAERPALQVIVLVSPPLITPCFVNSQLEDIGEGICMALPVSYAMMD
jgi:hypothetical protein